MLNAVMVALDGSEKGGRALSISLALSELADIGVHLVRIIPPTPARVSNQAELIGVDSLAASGELDVEKQLSETARTLTSQSRRPISWEVVDAADVPSALIRVAEERDVTAVVMGTRAATGAGLAIVGSVADRVMRECPKPVVLVPPGAADVSGKRIEIKRVLVPLDGSELAERSMAFLLGLSHIDELEFVLVGVVHNPDDAPFVRRRLHVAADRFRGRSAAATPRVILGGNAANAIASAVREFLVDMIVMSTRGESGLRRLILGSVAEGVVRAAEVPVLLLTPTMLAARKTSARSAIISDRVTERSMSGAEHHHLSHDEHSLEPIHYPRQNVVAVIDTAGQVEDAVNELTAGGFLESEIGIGSGADVADRVRETTGRSGFTAMAMRFSEALGVPNDESEIKAQYEQAMRDGRFVVAVLAPTAERKQRAIDILSSHGAHDAAYFGRFVIEKLQLAAARGSQSANDAAANR
jgi:nucleotide-binding universal stress UspA family protein